MKFSDFKKIFIPEIPTEDDYDSQLKAGADNIPEPTKPLGLVHDSSLASYSGNRALFEALDSRTPISKTDLGGKIVYVNDKFSEISKYPREELIGQNHRILKSGFHLPALYNDLWDTISKGKIWQGEIKNKAKDGSFYWVDTMIAPIFGTDGQVDSYMSIQFPITPHKEIEEIFYESNTELEEVTAELKRSQAVTLDLLKKIEDERKRVEAETAERNKNEIFDVTSHKLLTPLTAMRFTSEMVLEMYGDKITDDNFKTLLKEIHGSIVHLIHVVHEFLLASRLEQQNVVFENKQFDVIELTESVIKTFQKKAEEKHLVLSFESPEKQPFLVMADPDKVKTVLKNLIDNGIRFTHSGSVTVSVQEEDGGARIRICDTGVGVADEKKNMLFKKFQTVEEETPSVRNIPKGAGLGLYNARLMVEKMNGKIGLEHSELGSGSVFYVVFPVVE